MALSKDFIVKEGIQVNGTSSSISTSTGALIVNGGFGLGGDIWVGGKITRNGDISVSTYRGAAFSLNSATYTDSTLKGTTSLAAISYFGPAKINSTNTGVIVTNAATLYIDGAPNTSSTKLSFSNAWSTYIRDGNVYIGSTSTNASSTAGNALQIVGGLSANTLFVPNGGSIGGVLNVNNSEVITKATQGAGDLTFSGIITINSSTNSTTKDNGALVVENGGMGVEKNVNIGGTLGIFSTTNATSTSTGAIFVKGGVGIGQDLYASNGFFVSGLSNINTVSGNSLQVTNNGGLGVSGTARFESSVILSSTDDSTNVSSGALIISGGAGIGKTLTALNVVATDVSPADLSGGGLIVNGGALVKKNIVIGSTDSNAYSTSSNALYVVGGVGIAKDIIVGGNAVIQGNLTILQTGTQLVVNSTQTYIADPVIDIGGGANGDPLQTLDIFDKGLMIHYNNGTTTADNNHAFFGFEHTTGRFILKKNIYPGASNQYPINDLKNTGTYAAFDLGSLKVLDTTDSLGIASGALTVAGGVGIAQQLQVGGKITANNSVDVNGVLTVGTVQITSGLVVDGSLSATTGTYRTLKVSGTVGSTGSTNGDLVVSGGIGVDNVYARILNVESSLNSSNTSTSGALQVAGGVGVGRDMFVGGTVTSKQLKVVSNLLSSASATTSTNSKLLIDSFVGAEFTSAKYFVQIRDIGSPIKFHISEIILAYDSSGASEGIYISQYGILTNTGELGTFEAEYVGGSIRLFFTPNYTPIGMGIEAIRTSITSGG